MTADLTGTADAVTAYAGRVEAVAEQLARVGVPWLGAADAPVAAAHERLAEAAQTRLRALTDDLFAHADLGLVAASARLRADTDAAAASRAAGRADPATRHRLGATDGWALGAPR
ncbi:hypothetical protein Cs7R123_20830 [Catellatospora sp. TT07R-123]|uniref:hypothetical protein n=1 Tax=Catellatospora sp. TT07R-123 TaxID=2733863 RepID=UPI001B285F58|nr:hypothetical protein [Catellatospora sp. TT07R-123]GHJ44741.1 hypothetical protein Cs7R123_20830 [Catellatospora sp. TT07R-123]